MNNQKITIVLIVAYLTIFFYIFLSMNEYMDAKKRVAIFSNDKRIKKDGKTFVKFALSPTNKKGIIIKRNIPRTTKSVKKYPTKKNMVINNKIMTPTPVLQSSITQSPIAQSPIQPFMTESPTQSPMQPFMTESPMQPFMTESPTQSPMQQFMTESPMTQ